MTDSPVVERMNGLESLMWALERDPALSSTFANVSILDRTPDLPRLRATMERAALAVPRLRLRVVEDSPLRAPGWQEDPFFDIDRHLQVIHLGGGAGLEELHQLVATLVRRPLDTSHPLWEFIIISGLEGGRAAMVQRMDHTITDGEGGIRLSVEFVDIERDPPPRPPVRPAEPAPDTTAADTTAADTTATATAAPDTAAEAEATGGRPRWDPSRLRDLGVEVVETARSVGRQVQPSDRMMSPLWTERSLGRWFTTLDRPLPAFRTAAKRLGGTINDVFVTAAAGGAGRYHRELGHEVAELQMAMPVSTRRDRSAGGNQFAPTRSAIAVGIEDPAERFRHISGVLGRTRAERAIGLVGRSAGMLTLLPGTVVTTAGRFVTGGVDFVTSNVRAAPFDLFIAGARMESNYPIGPLAGTAFNLTTMSYRDVMWMGLVVDPAAVAEPERLRRCIDVELDLILDALPTPGGSD